MSRLIRSSAVALVLLLILWATVGPQALGGPVAAVAVTGTSMLPGIEQGDLVLVRRSGTYEVGDVVAYRHPELGIVLHRIVGSEAGRFVLRGDNLKTNDRYQPTASEIVGTQWARVPGAASLIGHLTAPRQIAMLLLAGVVLSAAGSTSQSTKRERTEARMGGQRADGSRNVGRFGVHGPLGIELLGLGLLFAAGGIALFLLIGAQGVTRSESEAVSYQVQGTLSYTPDANAEPVVVETDNRTAQPPPPVIRRLTDRLSLQYRVDVVGGGTAAPEQLSGSQRLSLELRHQSGASEPLSLASTMPLVASSTTLTGTLDLAELEQAIERFQTRTGVAGGPYRLVATAGAEVAGTLEGEPFTASLQQALTFTFDDILLLVEPGQSTPLAEAIGEVERGLEVPREASLPLLGAVRYTHLRIAGFAAAAIGILLLQLVLTSTLLGRRTSETARIRVRHGRMIVVAQTGVALPDQLIDIETIDELAAIAEREQRPIVELANGRGTDYLVMESGLAFRFHAGSRART